jgi:hypothetical protein
MKCSARLRKMQARVLRGLWRAARGGLPELWRSTRRPRDAALSRRANDSAGPAAPCSPRTEGIKFVRASRRPPNTSPSRFSPRRALGRAGASRSRCSSPISKVRWSC